MPGTFLVQFDHYIYDPLIPRFLFLPFGIGSQIRWRYIFLWGGDRRIIASVRSLFKQEASNILVLAVTPFYLWQVGLVTNGTSISKKSHFSNKDKHDKDNRHHDVINSDDVSTDAGTALPTSAPIVGCFNFKIGLCQIWLLWDREIQMRYIHTDKTGIRTKALGMLHHQTQPDILVKLIYNIQARQSLKFSATSSIKAILSAGNPDTCNLPLNMALYSLAMRVRAHI